MTAKTHVAYCVDKQYYQHFGASVTSLLKNHGQDSDTLHIHVFTDSDDASLKLKLASLQNAFGARFETHILSAKETRIFSGLPLVDYISVATYFRFLMADLLPAEAERVIYLDADTIVLSSIRQLYEIDMQHRTIAGVTDFSAQPMQERLGLRHYINAGVLLIDLQRWRKNNYSRPCIDYARSHGDKLVFADQCVINLVLQDARGYCQADGTPLSCRMAVAGISMVRQFFTSSLRTSLGRLGMKIPRRKSTGSI